MPKLCWPQPKTKAACERNNRFCWTPQHQISGRRWGGCIDHLNSLTHLLHGHCLSPPKLKELPQVTVEHLPVVLWPPQLQWDQTLQYSFKKTQHLCDNEYNSECKTSVYTHISVVLKCKLVLSVILSIENRLNRSCMISNISTWLCDKCSDTKLRSTEVVFSSPWLPGHSADTGQ